jgi:hypothetical protein
MSELYIKMMEEFYNKYPEDFIDYVEYLKLTNEEPNGKDIKGNK